MTDLSTLLSRVESGSGDDAALTYELWVAFKEDLIGFWSPNALTDLNAVVALVEAKRPDANCHGYDKDPKGVTGYVSRNCVADGHWSFEGHHADTPARALLAALIRAEMEKGTAR